MKELVIILLLLSVSVACTSKIDPAEQGRIIFNKKHLGKNKVIGCVLCHSIEPSKTIVGPSLAGLSIRAAHLVSGQTAHDYIKSSIINPDAYIVDGFLPAVMFSHYQQELTEEQIENLVSYLLLL